MTEKIGNIEICRKIPGTRKEGYTHYNNKRDGQLFLPDGNYEYGFLKSRCLNGMQCSDLLSNMGAMMDSPKQVA